MPCYDFANFGSYFKENMNALGLPAPTELFGTATADSGILHRSGDWKCCGCHGQKSGLRNLNC